MKEQKNKKQLVFFLLALIVLLVISVTLLTKVLDRNKSSNITLNGPDDRIEETDDSKTNKKDQDDTGIADGQDETDVSDGDFHSFHPEIEKDDVIFEDSEDGVKDIGDLKLTAPVAIDEASNPEGSVELVGVTEDNVLLALGHKGELYEYNIESKSSKTYDILVDIASFTKDRNTVVYVKEDPDTRQSTVYKISLDYPEKKVLHTFEHHNYLFLENAIIKDHYVLKVMDLDKDETKAIVLPINSDKNDSFGESLQKNITADLSEYASNGNKFIAFNQNEKSVYDLSNGKAKKIETLKDKNTPYVYLGVSDNNTFISSFSSDDNDNNVVTNILNGKEIDLEEQYISIDFFNDDYAILNDEMQLHLFNAKTGEISALDNPGYFVNFNEKNIFYTKDNKVYNIGVKKER